jgi:hypothetical protein
MGSRYGWLKQIDEFGPWGQSLLEYAVYDAVNAWFNHIVLVIRKEFEQAFREKFVQMLASVPSYDFVYQTVSEWREKPWGTLDATVCARSVVNGPFAVVNADDRYGTTSYQLLADQLVSIQANQAYLVWYTLRNTLSDYGTVNRGVCHGEGTRLTDVTERYAIGYQWDQIIDRNGNVFDGNETVSMNFWWFHQQFFDDAQGLLEQFKRDYQWDPKAEMVIPDAVDHLVTWWKLVCDVLDSHDPWQGVTNPEDKEKVAKAFDLMHSEWLYPQYLWK